MASRRKQKARQTLRVLFGLDHKLAGRTQKMWERDQRRKWHAAHRSREEAS